MNYFRTSSGSMMAIHTKSSTLIAVSKQKAAVKPNKKLKKASPSDLK
jgi:hypothetical protein